MAKTVTERVDKYRKANFDHVSLLVEKGGRRLLHAMAIREGVSMTEMLRRAILARAGLRMMPYPDKLEELTGIETQEEARVAIRKLQAHEESSEIIQHLINKMSPEKDEAGFTVRMDHADIYELRDAMARINAAIEAEGPPSSPMDDSISVRLTGREVGILRRFLSNIIPDRGE